MSVSGSRRAEIRMDDWYNGATARAARNRLPESESVGGKSKRAGLSDCDCDCDGD